MFRRQFLHYAALASAAFATGQTFPCHAQLFDRKIKFGFCTSGWGKNWDLNTLLAFCGGVGVQGVELSVGDAHNVTPALSTVERADIKKRFESASIAFIGMDTCQSFDSPDPEFVKICVQDTKAFILLSEACGGSGVKVLPKDFHDNVPKEVTIEQIGKALREVASFGAEHNQLIRLEMDGTCGDPETIKKILQAAAHPNVKICWETKHRNLYHIIDRERSLYESNIGLLRDYLGDTLHIHELNSNSYPYSTLFSELTDMEYEGWALFEGQLENLNGVREIEYQKKRFYDMIDFPECCLEI